MEEISERIRRTAQFLSRKDLSLQPVFQEGLSVARRMQRVDPPLDVIKSLNSTFKPKLLPDRIPIQARRPSSYIAEAATVYDALDGFLNQGMQELEAPASFLLLVGPEGCGKTHICDEIERRAGEESRGLGIPVLRPRLPIDILGSSVGETEDTLVSFFSAAIGYSGRVVILDDLEQIFEETQSLLAAAPGAGDTPGSHLKTRSQSTLLSMIDSIQRSSQDSSRVLVVCTARQDIGGVIGRFDRTYHLESPNENERRKAILSHLGIKTVLKTDSANFDLLSNLVESTVGRSHAEIAQYCRQAIGHTARSKGKDALVDDAFEILSLMKGQLQSMAPESLRNGITDDFVDMRVMTARDLGASREIAQDLSAYAPPLFGSSVELAWKELQASIVIPLCRSRELNDLLDPTDKSSRKVVTGGLLLTGGPGSGKTQIAYHCARYAASLLPSLKLLDVSCTSLIHKEVGGSESAVHHLFECARKAAPCILLMDGIENIAAVRGNDPTVEGTLDRVLSTLLVELDGVDDHPASDQAGGVAIIGITHNVNWIDQALQRPGRLEKCVELGYPDDGARFQIVSNNLSAAVDDEKGLPVPAKVIKEVAQETEGMAAASIVAVCNDVRMTLACEADLAPGTIKSVVQGRRSNPA
jgi:SpoVK/Ycf46/Vps4 family AAA+-type ATPase